MENQLQVQPSNEVDRVNSQVPNPMDILKVAIQNESFDIEKMERLIAMQEKWEKNQAEKAYNQAMSLAQKEIGAVRATMNNKQTNSKYAGIVGLDAAIRPHYTAQGIAISFNTAEAPNPDSVRILAYITHEGGHKETRHIDIPADGKGAKGGDVMTKTHAVMSATTYGQRALLKMIFNIASGEFDDDGNGAGKKPNPPKELPFLEPDTESWGKAIIALKGAYKMADIKKKYRITPENEEKLQNDVMV